MILQCEFSFSQYVLSEEEVIIGFNYLKKESGFKNPSSVQYISHSISKKQFQIECFTWARFDIRAQNSYGGYGSSSYVVFFYDGKPISSLSEDHPYYMYANKDEVANEIIELAKTRGTLVNTICAKQAAEKKLLEKNRLENDSKNYDAIDKALNANNLQLVKLTTEKLNFPAAYPRYSEYLEKETKEKDRLQKQQAEKIRIELEQKTKEIEKKIQNSLEANDFLLAYETYKTHKTNFNLSSYEPVLYNGLTDLFRKDTILLSNEETFNFISSNQKALVNFKEGLYKFYFDTEGKCLNNNQLTSISKIPQKLVGDLNISNLKIGDRYQGNIVIKINESEIVLSSPKPIGSGDFPSAISQCSNFSANNFYWRLPNPEELISIFSLKNNLDSYENNWYWTNNQNGENAEHIGIQRSDRGFVPKTHGKWFFAVTSISLIKIPLNSTLNISITELKDVILKTDYFSSSTKPIFHENNVKFFYKTKMSRPLLTFNYNASILKNVVQIVKLIENVKKANETIVFREEIKTTEDYMILKKE
jgi:hypothetical protein